MTVEIENIGPIEKISIPVARCEVCGAGFQPRSYRHCRLHRRVYSRTCSLSCRQRMIATSDGARDRFDRVRGTGQVAPYVKRGGRHEHRAVVEAALGRRLSSDEIVHHIDGDTKNNDPANLEVMSRSGHAYEHGLPLASAKLTSGLVRAIRQRYANERLSRANLAREYGVSKSNIGRILRRESWRHVT